MNLYLVEDCDSSTAHYSHLFNLPEGMTAVAADLVLDEVMDKVQEELEWNWDDAISILADFGWEHLSFEVCSNSY